MILRDSATGKGTTLAELKHAPAIAALAYSPDGTQIAAAGTGGRVILWDVSRISPLVPAR